MESEFHQKLVKKIYRHVISLSNVEGAFVYCDSTEVSGNVKRMIEGYVPDVYYKYNNCVIIGEAKTENDLERLHSVNQYQAYISHLDEYCEMGYECCFIISVPWQASISAFRMIRRMLQNKRIKLIVINEMGVFREYEKSNT